MSAESLRVERVFLPGAFVPSKIIQLGASRDTADRDIRFCNIPYSYIRSHPFYLVFSRIARGCRLYVLVIGRLLR